MLVGNIFDGIAAPRAASGEAKDALCVNVNFCVPDVSTQFSIYVVRGPRFRALGVNSGPREGAFEGVLDPRTKNIYIYIYIYLY